MLVIDRKKYISTNYTYIYLHTDIYIHIYLYWHTHTHISMIFTHAHTHAYVHTYTYTLGYGSCETWAWVLILPLSSCETSGKSWLPLNSFIYEKQENNAYLVSGLFVGLNEVMYVIFPSPRPDALKRFPVLLSLLLFLLSLLVFLKISFHMRLIR